MCSKFRSFSCLQTQRSAQVSFSSEKPRQPGTAGTAEPSRDAWQVRCVLQQPGSFPEKPIQSKRKHEAWLKPEHFWLTAPAGSSSGANSGALLVPLLEPAGSLSLLQPGIIPEPEPELRLILAQPECLSWTAPAEDTGLSGQIYLHLFIQLLLV